MSEYRQPGEPARERRPGVVRLVFEYEGDDVRLLSRRRVDMLAPPSDTLKGHERQQGFWAEVRSADGSTLYRHVMPDPVRRDVEVFSNDPEQSISRVPVDRPVGVFTLLVPETKGAEYLALVRSAPELTGLRAGNIIEVLRVPLTPKGEQDTP